MDIGEIQRPPKEIIAGFIKIPTSVISDVLDKMGINGIVNELQHFLPGSRIAGPAFTAKHVTGVLGMYTVQEGSLGKIIDMIENGDIFVVDMAGKKLSNLGDRVALAMKLKGVAGAVVDGGVRDIDGIAEVGFPVHARHACATNGVGRRKLVGINVPVQIDDIRVNPGDIIVADDTAVAIVPAEKAGEILQQCQKIEESEKQFEKALKEGMTFSEATKKWGNV